MHKLRNYLNALKPGDFTVALIKPSGQFLRPKVKTALSQKPDTEIVDCKYTGWHLATVLDVYWVHHDKPYYSRIEKEMLSGTVGSLLLVGPDIQKSWREYVMDVRSQYSHKMDNPAANFLHGSDSHETAYREALVLFGDSFSTKRGE